MDNSTALVLLPAMPVEISFVAEWNNHRVQVFDRNKKFLFKFGSSGAGNGELDHPANVVFNGKTNQLVVSDTFNHRIQIFDSKGVFKSTFGRGNGGDGEFLRPYGVAFDKEGNYIVADWNNQIQVINAKGKFLRKFGTKGTGPGQLKYPCGVGILSTGNIVVSEYHNHRLQIFTPQGQFVSFVGVGMLTKPGHLCVGPDDDIYVLSFLPTAHEDLEDW